jgi:hypothetical protein
VASTAAVRCAAAAAAAKGTGAATAAPPPLAATQRPLCSGHFLGRIWTQRWPAGFRFLVPGT